MREEEQGKIVVSSFAKYCYTKLTDEFRFVKAQAVEPLTTFMEYIEREKMIDNVCMIIQGALNNKHPQEMLEKLHPLGWFENIDYITRENFLSDNSGNFDDLYNTFLVDTPIGSYFEEYLMCTDPEMKGIEKEKVGGILSQQDLETMKAMLKKLWLEDFY